MQEIVPPELWNELLRLFDFPPAVENQLASFGGPLTAYLFDVEKLFGKVKKTEVKGLVVVYSFLRQILIGYLVSQFGHPIIAGFSKWPEFTNRFLAGVLAQKAMELRDAYIGKKKKDIEEF